MKMEMTMAAKGHPANPTPTLSNLTQTPATNHRLKVAIVAAPMVMGEKTAASIHPSTPSPSPSS